MVPRRHPSYAPRTIRTVELLGMEISRARVERRITQAELAERAGISPDTLSSIEQGSPTVAIGTVFEVAHLLGIDLLVDGDDLDAMWSRTRQTLALLPGRVRQTLSVDDNF
jgi:transcriptional regulator with XRE-family HTH domain